MKSKKSLIACCLIVALVVCCMAAFAACSDNVVGTYKFSSATRVTSINGRTVKADATQTYAEYYNCADDYYTFNEDGTGESNVGEFTWTKNGNTVTITYEGSNFDESAATESFTVKNNSIVIAGSGSAYLEIVYKKQ